MRTGKAVFLVVVMLLLAPLYCTAVADITSGNYTYKVNSSGKAIITRYFGDDVSVVVPDSIPML